MSKTNRHEVEVKIDKKTWEQALDKAFQKKVKDIKIDGFRKGKVPFDVYEKKFGIETLYMDAIDVVLPTAYSKALKENKLVPVVQPKVDIKSITNETVEINFHIITKPSLKLGQYKGLKVAKRSVEVSKEEINNEIDKLKNQYVEFVIKEGKIETGDVAVIDFEGFKDGVLFEGGKDSNYSLEIGSHTFIPGFEEQLIGMQKDETKEITITFPDNYLNEELKGKEVIFKVTIKEVKNKVVPNLDEDFFNDLQMPEVKDKKALEKLIKKEITAKKEIDIENEFVDHLLEAVKSKVEVDIPEEMTNEEKERMLNRYIEQLKMQGIDIEQYYKLTATTEEDLMKQMTEQAEKHVIYRLMLDEIATKEKIIITDAEAKKEAKKLAGKYQMKEDEFLKLFGGLELVKYDLQMRKTIELLKENN